MSCALEKVGAGAARAGAARQTLPRPSAVALGKRRDLATTPPAPAPNTRPYATPKELNLMKHRNRIAGRDPATPTPRPDLMWSPPNVGPSSFLSVEYLEQLYAILVPPPVTQLAALAARIPHAKLGAQHAALVELCCIHTSFWDAVDAAQPIAADRTEGYTNFHDDLRASNLELAALGESLLGLFAHEWLEARYPNMPERPMRALVEMHVGLLTSADVARTWGVAAGTTSRPREPLAAEIRNEHGRTAGQSVLRWQRPGTEAVADKASKRKDDAVGDEAEPEEQFPDLYEPRILELSPSIGKPAAVEAYMRALASVGQAVVGAVFQEHGYAQARQFVHNNWLSRKANILSVLRFEKPKRLLLETLTKFEREPASIRLLKESGRDSDMPVFVHGVFSGEEKLGEAYASSIAESIDRAAEDALRKIYLARAVGPSGLLDLHDDPPLPSDELVPAQPGMPTSSAAYEPLPLGDDEVEFGRNRQPFKTRAEALASPFRPDGRPPGKVNREPTPRQSASERRPTRPLTGPGSKDPSLPLEDRVPRFIWERQGSGPRGRREKGNDRPTKPVPTKIQSPYYGPFDQSSLPHWPLPLANAVRAANRYPDLDPQAAEKQKQLDARKQSEAPKPAPGASPPATRDAPKADAPQAEA